MADHSLIALDVLVVLLAEFEATLLRKGFRRHDARNMYKRAKVRLEHERLNETGEGFSSVLRLLAFD